MKSIKAIAVSTLLTLSFTSAVWAAEAPAACPKIDLIQKAGLAGVQVDKDDSLYVTYQINKYGTPATWAFILGVPLDQATSRGDAMNKAKAALATLAGSPEPVATNKDNNQWYCLYENDYKYIAITVTPLSVSNEMVHSTIFNLKK